MIQDIAPHRYDNAYHPTQPKDGDRVFFYQDGSTLLSRESGLPSVISLTFSYALDI